PLLSNEDASATEEDCRKPVWQVIVGRLSEASNGKSSCRGGRPYFEEQQIFTVYCIYFVQQDIDFFYFEKKMMEDWESWMQQKTAILVHRNVRSTNLNLHQEINTLSLNKDESLAKNTNLGISEEDQEDQEEGI
ncbi:1513_t:CDS:2, partial [Acaulospora morrowiae]